MTRSTPLRLALVCSALGSGPGLVLQLGAAEPAPVPVTVVAPAATPDGIPVRPAEELDELLGPIALYPDILIALILPASTFPDDLTRAGAFLQANGNPNDLARQPWDASVQALAHYPEIVRWMNDNLPWVRQVGDAFTVQSADVMKSIQRLRTRAVASGALVSTPEQTVIHENGEIRIVPAQPEVVYVPRYEPTVVYADVPAYAYSSSLSRPVYFGAAFATGSWLAYDLNWDTYVIWVSPWRPRYDYRHPAWRRPVYGPPIVGRPWQPVGPPPHRHIWPVDQPHRRPPVVRPPPLPGTPARPPGFVGYQPQPGVNPNPRTGGMPAQPDGPPAADRHPAPPGRGRTFGPRVEPDPGIPPQRPGNTDPRQFPPSRPRNDLSPTLTPPPANIAPPLPVRPPPVNTTPPALVPGNDASAPTAPPDRPTRRPRPEGSPRNEGNNQPEGHPRNRGGAIDPSPTPLPSHHATTPTTTPPPSAVRTLPARPSPAPAVTPPAPASNAATAPAPSPRTPSPAPSYRGDYNRSGGNPGYNDGGGRRSGGNDQPRQAAPPPATRTAPPQPVPARPAQPAPVTQPATEQPASSPPANPPPDRRRGQREGT